MPRSARIVIPGLAHHVTQRGARRAHVFFRPEDRVKYLKLLKFYADRFGVQVAAYCLMTNHVHLVLVPLSHAALSRTLSVTHMRYAQFINTREGWSGHLWQERFYSCPLDGGYFLTAVRYTERNPVAAGMVRNAWDYPWSSASSHCGLRDDALISKSPEIGGLKSTITNWQAWLSEVDSAPRLSRLRECTARDLPCGSEPFLDQLEENLKRPVRPRRRQRKNFTSASAS